jgi:hypothetical protein
VACSKHLPASPTPLELTTNQKVGSLTLSAVRRAVILGGRTHRRRHKWNQSHHGNGVAESLPEEQYQWRGGVYDEIQEVMPLQGSLSIERMCQLAGVSRAGFYRSLQERAPFEEDMEVRNVIQQIAVEHRRRYGYRRISAELRRRGMLVNHKRVLRIIRENNLLAVQPRAFVVTTDSDHEFEVYLNLAGRMKLTGMNQLWVADITYIRLKKEFVYLAVILDAFSRKVVGWALDRTLWSRPTPNYSPRQDWCIIPTVACSTLLETT